MEQENSSELATAGVSTSVTGKIAIKKKERNEKVNQSRFFVTLNTNKSYKDESKRQHLDNDAQILDGLTNEMLTNMPQFIKFLEPNHAWDDKYIVSSNADYAIECGNERGFLHTHMMIDIRHRSRIHLDQAKIKQFFQERLGLGNLHLQIKLVRKDEGLSIYNYINKYTEV